MGARDLLDGLAEAGISVAVDGDKLVIRPASRLTDDIRAALRASKPELLALLVGRDSHAAPPSTRTCAGCLHRTRVATCGKPVEAGLTRHFEIIWAPAGYAATCRAFESNAAKEATA